MMIIASICFSLVAVMVKYIRHLPLMEIILFRNIPTMIIIPIILKKKGIPFFGNNKLVLLMRGFFWNDWYVRNILYLYNYAFN